MNKYDVDLGYSIRISAYGVEAEDEIDAYRKAQVIIEEGTSIIQSSANLSNDGLIFEGGEIHVVEKY